MDASYEYNGVGQLTSRTDETGTTAYTYDDLGRLTSVTDGAGQTVTWAYDKLGRITSRTQPGATTTFSYDAVGRLLNAADPAGSASWSYNDVGSPIAATLPNDVSVDWDYDAAHRPVSLTYTHGTTGQLFREQLTYDSAGRVTQIADPVGARTFGYDAASQLVSENNAGVTQGYTYDPVGNRLTKQDASGTTAYSYDAADQLSSAGDLGFTYDANGNLTEVVDSATSETWTYQYDAQGFLVETGLPDGSAVTYGVDDDGLMLTQTQGVDTTTYLFDRAGGAFAPIATTGGSNPTRTLVAGDAFGYVDARGLTVPILDHLGSGRGTVDSAGLAALTNFTAFGEPIGTNGPQLGRTGFAQGLSMPGDLVRMGQRFYAPSLGRFLTPEPQQIREASATQSMYVYARNNPVNRATPPASSA